MTTAEFRAWRENVPQLIGKGGRIVRAVEAAEEAALFPIVKRARETGDGLLCRMRYPIDGIKNSTGPHAERIVKVDVQKLGPGIGQHVIHVFVDGTRYVTGREIICARLLRKHGEVVLKRPNNTFLRMLRDPTKQRPTYEESSRQSPMPVHCDCKGWGQPHPGRHHRACPHNSKSPPNERAIESLPAQGPALDEIFPDLDPVTNGRAGVSPTAAQPAGVTTTRTAPVAPARVLPKPDDCPNGCLKWPMPRGMRQEAGQHNPICQYFEEYKANSVLEEPMYILDLETGERVRRASVEEAAQAAVNLRTFGASIISIGDERYAVLPSEDGIQAQRLAVAHIDKRMRPPPKPTLTATPVIQDLPAEAPAAPPIPAATMDGEEPLADFSDGLTIGEGGSVDFVRGAPLDEAPSLALDEIPTAEEILLRVQVPAPLAPRIDAPPLGAVRESDHRAIVEPATDEEIEAGVFAHLAPPSVALNR